MKVQGLGRDPELIVGIDLGTTNSLIAIVRDGVPVVLRSREGGALLPSVVSVIDGEPVVGLRAKRAKVVDASHTAFSVKRLLGRGFSDLKAEKFPYKLVPGDEGIVRIQLGEKVFTAIEISAMILRELKRSAEVELGTPVRRAVITVPAYFNDSQRQATRTAGRLAGLDVLRIVNEPTAAALAYGLDQKKQGLIAVYDLGGGTFDVSILKLRNGVFEVLATNGDTELGGDDLDRVLVKVCSDELLAARGIQVGGDVTLLASLLEAAERAKIELSAADSATIEIPVGGKLYSRRFERAEFERLVAPILERTREPCVRALADAKLTFGDLSDVVLVGGPTRLAIVQGLAREIFGREPNTSVHPDEVVAAGAAIQADILAGGSRDLLLLDVVPLSLGIETYGGVFSPLIHRNTKVPAVARETFTTFVDNQTGVDIHVLQGERDRIEDNRSLAKFKLPGIEPMPAGLPRIEVTFLVDADGILQVSAKDLRTLREHSVEVRPSHGLTEAEVQEMLSAQARFAETDVRFRELVEARNQVEPVLKATEKSLAAARNLLTDGERDAIERDQKALASALEGSDPALIRAAGSALSTSTTRLAQLVLTEALRSGQ